MMTDTQQPLVSIIIASYNHAEYVEDAIRSVMEQTYCNIQMIVIDDASPDDSALRISALNAERRFLFLQNKRNIGLQRSLSMAMEHVTGEYLGIFASDDMIQKNKIERQVAFLQQYDLDGVYSNCYLLLPDNTRVLVDLSAVEEMFLRGSYLNHLYVCDSYGALFQSGLFRSKALQELRHIRESFWSDDWAIAIKMMENYRVGFLNEPFALYRQHENNTHKQYWTTFPGRVQVVSSLTPLELRHIALSNLLASQADYLVADHQRPLARRFYLASLAMDFSFKKLTHYISSLNIHPVVWLSHCKKYAVRFVRKVLLLPKRIL